MRLRAGDRVAMTTVAVLAMWPVVILNLVGWLALWRFHVVSLDTWSVLASTWPIPIDLIILRVGLIQASQAARALSDIQVLATALTTLLRQGEAREQKTAEILARLDAAHAQPAVTVQIETGKAEVRGDG